MQMQFNNQRNKLFQDLITHGKEHSATLGFMSMVDLKVMPKRKNIVFASLNEQSSLYPLYRQVKTLNKPVTLLWL